jgi:serine/threonine protein kinase
MRDDTLVQGGVARAGGGGGRAGAGGWGVRGYTGVRALGSGGFGRVVLARHDESGTQVAIKYLRHRRQPGRQRYLRRRTPGPARYQGHPDTPVPRSFLFLVGFCG